MSSKIRSSINNSQSIHKSPGKNKNESGLVISGHNGRNQNRQYMQGVKNEVVSETKSIKTRVNTMQD